MRKAFVWLVTTLLFGAGRVCARAARVLNHLAAGTLTIRELRVGIERSWEEFGAGDAEVAAGLTRQEEAMVARFVSRDDEVLLIGSGAGRDLIALVGDGYHVTAVEPARRAIATARRQLERRGLSADIIEGFFEDVALRRRFDVIIFSGCCYTFIPESRRRVAALRKAGDHLSARGRILVSYMAGAPVHPMLIQLARLASRVAGSDWHPEPGDVVLPIDPRRPLFHYEHPFRPGELESEASAAGLRTVDCFDVPGGPCVVLEPAHVGASEKREEIV